MPITKSAIKKQRADKSKRRNNLRIASQMKTAIIAAKTSPTKDTVAKMYSTLDVAVKKHIIKRNRAARVKAGVVRIAKVKQVKALFGKSGKAAKKKAV